MKPGKLITFEGIEGCGKSTQIQKAAEWLSAQKIPFIATREPGGTESGRKIREILLSERTVSLEPLAEALLYLADRFQHIRELIQPHLEAGEIVLCDRYHDSTVAYQGYARGISLDLLDQIWQRSGIAAIPDLTILFDIDPEIGIRRSMAKLKQSGLDESRFENESLEFHRAVRNGFLDLARRNQNRFQIIDASQSVDDVHQKVVQLLKQFITGG